MGLGKDEDPITPMKKQLNCKASMTLGYTQQTSDSVTTQ